MGIHHGNCGNSPWEFFPTVTGIILTMKNKGLMGFKKIPQLVGGLEHGFYDFPCIGNSIIPTDELISFRGVGIPLTIYGIILPIDELIFFKMVKTTNQSISSQLTNSYFSEGLKLNHQPDHFLKISHNNKIEVFWCASARPILPLWTHLFW